MSAIREFGWAAALLVSVSAAASAQTDPAAVGFRQCTTAGVLAGGGFATSDRGFVGGASIGWGITPRLTIEGRVLWLDRDPGSEGFTAGFSANLGLASLDNAEPYLKGGVGFYRASFDTAQATPPAFYRRRIAEDDSAARTTYAFADPAVAVGGGVKLVDRRHFTIRSEIEAMIAWHDADGYVITAVTVHFVYHFEDHAITPARRRR
jgi:hypothetical protein